MASKVVWLGNEWFDEFEKRLNRNLKKAAVFLTNQVKNSISVGAPPASKPGEPPHVGTGALRSSITWVLDENKHIARIGSNLVYSKYLETGTAHMEAREFLQRALNENRGVIMRILKAK